MRIATIIWLALSFWVSPQLHGQENFTLKRCLDYAKVNHQNIKIATNKVASSIAQRSEGLSLYMPQINGSVSFDDNLIRPTTIIPAGTFSPTELRVQFGNQFASNAVVQLDQLIYDQSILSVIKASKPYLEMTELQKAKTVEDVLYNTASAYFQVLVVREQRILLEQNTTKFERLESILKLSVAKGVAREVDLQRVSVGLSNLKTQVEMLKSNEDLLVNRLKLAMGMPIDQKIALSDSLAKPEKAEDPQMKPFSEEKLLDVKILEKSVVLQEFELKRSQASRIPTVSAYGRYGAQAFGNDLGESFDTWFDYAAIGMRISVPIFAGFRRNNAIKQQELALENVKSQADMAIQQLQLRNENARVSLTSAYNNLGTSQLSINLAENVFQTTELEFNKGVANLSDLLNAEYALKEAQSNYIRALLSYMTARLDYEQSLGTLENYLQTL